MQSPYEMSQKAERRALNLLQLYWLSRQDEETSSQERVQKIGQILASCGIRGKEEQLLVHALMGMFLHAAQMERGPQVPVETQLVFIANHLDSQPWPDLPTD